MEDPKRIRKKGFVRERETEAVWLVKLKRYGQLICSQISWPWNAIKLQNRWDVVRECRWGREEKIFLISQDVKKSSLHPLPETGEKQEIFLFFPVIPFHFVFFRFNFWLLTTFSVFFPVADSSFFSFLFFLSNSLKTAHLSWWHSAGKMLDKKQILAGIFQSGSLKA